MAVGDSVAVVTQLISLLHGPVSRLRHGFVAFQGRLK